MYPLERTRAVFPRGIKSPHIRQARSSRIVDGQPASQSLTLDLTPPTKSGESWLSAPHACALLGGETRRASCRSHELGPSTARAAKLDEHAAEFTDVAPFIQRMRNARSEARAAAIGFRRTRHSRPTPPSKRAWCDPSFTLGTPPGPWDPNRGLCSANRVGPDGATLGLGTSGRSRPRRGRIRTVLDREDAAIASGDWRGPDQSANRTELLALNGTQQECVDARALIDTELGRLMQSTSGWDLLNAIAYPAPAHRATIVTLELSNEGTHP